MTILIILLSLWCIGDLSLFVYFFKSGKAEREEILAQRERLFQEESNQRAKLSEERGTFYDEQEKFHAQLAQLTLTASSISEREDNLKEYGSQLDNAKSELIDKSGILNIKELAISAREKDLSIKEASLEHLAEEYRARVERAAEMSLSEGKAIVLASAKKETEREVAILFREAKEETQRLADIEAQRIMTLAIERVAISQAPLKLTSQIIIADENFRGKLIGHEGKNIKLLEELAGVQVLTNNEDTKLLTVSAFNPISRELCKRTIEELMTTNFVNPKKIKEIYEKHSSELEKEILKTGRDACRGLGLSMPHTEIAKLLGKLKYRTSYGQNVLNHSIEVAQLCGALAGELKLDIRLAKRAGLLHDIGKAIDIEKEGTHPELGGIAARRYGEHEIVINAIESHHEDIEVINLISILVAVCDGISGSRPGARRNNLADYVKRIETLEGIALSFQGVTQATALQSGRDLRVAVNADIVDDAMSSQLASLIAKQIHDQMDYPEKKE